MADIKVLADGLKVLVDSSSGIKVLAQTGCIPGCHCHISGSVSADGYITYAGTDILRMSGDYSRTAIGCGDDLGVTRFCVDGCTDVPPSDPPADPELHIYGGQSFHLTLNCDAADSPGCPVTGNASSNAEFFCSHPLATACDPGHVAEAQWFVNCNGVYGSLAAGGHSFIEHCHSEYFVDENLVIADMTLNTSITISPA